MRLIIGLTGGIGSGKSTVAREFIKLGITVVDADKIARQIVEPGQPALLAIKQYFGASIISENGCLDRAKLRHIIFESEEKKNWLNALLHPLIRDTMLVALKEATTEYVILEAPLLFENNLTQYTDYNIVVDAPEILQIKRTMHRDSSDREQVLAIMAAQMPRNLRIQQADYIINNSGNKMSDLVLQITKLHAQLLLLSNNLD